jgi:excisionase family DNA binding protein
MSTSFNAATTLANWASLGIFPRPHNDQRLTRSQEGTLSTVSKVRTRGQATGKSGTVKPRCLKTNDAAAYLGVSSWKLRNLVQAGEIPCIFGDGTSPWLFDVQDLNKWVETQKRTL